jgi:hypothetical protein
MCILIHNTPKSNLTEAMFRDFIIRNGDGFGAAWSDGKKVHTIKLLDPTAKELAYVYNTHLKGKDAIIHLRMRTHGDIDFENCHPYTVSDHVVMAHNGVLSTGNHWDTSKSDTWHLIDRYLRPMLDKSPDLLFERSFQQMLGGFIGSGNRLGFVDAKRGVVVINRHSGINHKDTWFSNTYAWSPERFGYVDPSKKWSQSSLIVPKKAVTAPKGNVNPMTKAERKRHRKAMELNQTFKPKLAVDNQDWEPRNNASGEDRRTWGRGWERNLIQYGD